MDEKIEYPRFRWLILIAAIFGYITLQIANVSIAPILSKIAETLGVSAGHGQYLMSAFLFSGCVVQMTFGGFFCDRFGVIAAIFLGIVFATIPSTLMPLLGTTYNGLFWIRIFQGIAAGFLFPAMGAIIALWFPVRQRGLAGGIMGSSVFIGTSAGLMGGPVVYNMTGSFQKMSALLSVIGWLGLILTIILILMPRPKPPAQDQATGSGFDVSLYKRALLSPITWIGILLSFMISWGMQCLVGLTPDYLSADAPVGLGYGAVTGGQLMQGVTVAGILGPILCGILLDKVFKGNTKPVMALGFILMCVFIYALKIPLINMNVPLLVTALVLSGLGFQFVIPTSYVLVGKIYPNRIVANMTGLWVGLGTFGGVLGLFMGGLTLNAYGNYNVALLLMSLTSLIGTVLVFVLDRQKRLK